MYQWHGGLDRVLTLGITAWPHEPALLLARVLGPIQLESTALASMARSISTDTINTPISRIPLNNEFPPRLHCEGWLTSGM